MSTITSDTNLQENMIDTKLLQPEGLSMSISITMMWILLQEEIKQHPQEKLINQSTHNPKCPSTLIEEQQED